MAEEKYQASDLMAEVSQHSDELPGDEVGLETQDGEIYKAIINATRDAVILVRDGIIILWNDSAEALFGWTRPEAIGKRVHELIAAKKYHQQASIGMASFNSTGTGPAVGKTMELEACHKDGHEFPIELSLSSLKINGKLCAVGTVRDISKRKQTEDALKRSEEKYRELAEGTKDIVYSLNTEGNIIYIGPQVLKYGLKQNEMQGKNFLDFVHPDDREQIINTFTETIKSGTELTTEFRVVDSEGNVHWFEEIGRAQRDENGVIVKSTGVLRDITQRKQSEEALIESEEKFRMAFNTSPDSVNINRLSDGLYVSINPGFTKITGYTEEDIRGKTSTECHIWDKPEDRQRLVESLSQNGEFYNFETTFRTKDGRILYGLMSSSIIDLKGVPHIISITRDLTDLKRQEEENKRLQAQNAQSQKMEAIGQLAGGIAHDFNNLLTVILGSAEITRESFESNSEAYQELTEIINASRRASDLTRGILAYSRKQTLHVTSLNIASVVKDLNSTLIKRILHGTDISIDQNYDKDLWPIMADNTQIVSIIVNLVTNASHAMPQGGRITFDAKNICLDKDSLPLCEGAHPGNFVEFTIEDTGTGITPENLPKIFEPYFTTKGVGKGTGMGLSIIQGSIIQQGGFIDVESELGKGTKFRLYFPAVEQSNSPAIRKERQEKLDRGTETILLVEDDPEVRKITAKTLRRCGYTVIEAENAGIAFMTLKKMADEKKCIDLVLTDIQMPQISGTVLGENISETYPTIQIVYMSGYSNENSLSLVGKEFIAKPFSPQELSNRIRKVLDIKKKTRSKSSKPPKSF